MFLIPSDFKGKESLPNLGDIVPLSNKLGTDDFLISISEDEIEEEIISIIGWDLFNVIKSNVSPDLNTRFNPNTPQNILDLVNGKDGYKGMVKPLVHLAYFHYLREVNSELSGTGVKSTSSKTGKRYPAREKAVYSYNRYIKFMYGGDNKKTITENLGMLSIDYSSTNFNSVYKFLLENKDDYPELILGIKKTDLLNNFEI